MNEDTRKRVHSAAKAQAVLPMDAMYAAAAQGWYRISGAVDGATLDSADVTNRLLAFIEAHGLGEELLAYLLEQQGALATETDPAD